MFHPDSDKFILILPSSSIDFSLTHIAGTNLPLLFPIIYAKGIIIILTHRKKKTPIRREFEKNYCSQMKLVEIG